MLWPQINIREGYFCLSSVFTFAKPPSSLLRASIDLPMKERGKERVRGEIMHYREASSPNDVAVVGCLLLVYMRVWYMCAPSASGFPFAISLLS